MKLALALLLNAALLAVLLPWLRHEWRAAPRPLRRVLLPALALRLLVGVRPLSLDADLMSKLGRALTRLLWADPVSFGRHLLGDSFQLEGWNLARNGAVGNFLITSNSFFFSKLLAWLNLASGGIDWINGLYFSLFVFVGSWQLVRTLARAFLRAPAGAGAVALLLWPSVVGFASGITKEALLLGSGAWLVARVVGRLYANGKAGSIAPEDEAVDKVVPAGPAGAWRRAAWAVAGGVGTALLALLHFKIRYFFAVPLLLGLAGLALIRLAQRLGAARSRAAQVGLLLALLVAAGGVGPELSVVFTVNKFTSQLIKIYDRHLAFSAGKPHLEYPDLRPTGASALRHAPAAVWNCLTRPWLGESWAPAYLVGGLENLALLALLALAAAAVWRGRAGRLPFALGLGLGLHCLLLAFLIGLSTPNLGSLHRYRSGLLPYLVLLLLQNDYAAALLRRVGLGNEAGEGPGEAAAGPRPARPAAVSLPT